MSALAISGHSERFSPGEIRSKVGRQIALNSPLGRPTSERILPGDMRAGFVQRSTAAAHGPVSVLLKNC